MPNPIPSGTIGRTDMGVDIAASPGAKLINPVPGISEVVGGIANWFKGQPLTVFKVLSGPFQGKFWYAAEQVNITARPGQQIPQGAQIGTYAPSGTATEWGWAAGPSGQTLAQATTGYTEGQVTPAGTDFLNQIIRAPGGKGATGARAIGGSTVDGWQVTASQESDGGNGACGPIGTGGLWYSELSTVPMGTASDFHALGGLPCMTALRITNPVNGKSVIAHKRDVGAGSAFLPVMGLYPATAAALGLAGGQYSVVISRVDGQPLHPVRGKQVSGVAVGSSMPINRPGGGSQKQGGNTTKLFDDYETLMNTPRTAPAQSPSMPNGPFQWFWQSFTNNWKGANT